MKPNETLCFLHLAVLKFTSQQDSKPATNVTCIVSYLCDKFDGRCFCASN